MKRKVEKSASSSCDIQVLKEDDRVRFGHSLRVRRISLKLTQKEVASRLNISTTAYAKIERGKAGVNMERIRQLSSVLGMEVNLKGYGEEETLVSSLLLKEVYEGLMSLKQDVHNITEMLASEPEP